MSSRHRAKRMVRVRASTEEKLLSARGRRPGAEQLYRSLIRRWKKFVRGYSQYCHWLVATSLRERATLQEVVGLAEESEKCVTKIRTITNCIDVFFDNDTTKDDVLLVVKEVESLSLPRPSWYGHFAEETGPDQLMGIHNTLLDLAYRIQEITDLNSDVRKTDTYS